MTLLYKGNEQIVKAGARVRAHRNDVRIDKLNHLSNQLACRFPHELIFLWRFSYDRSGVYRISTPCHSSKTHDRKCRCLRIMSKVISEWSFPPSFMGWDHAFQ